MADVDVKTESVADGKEVKKETNGEVCKEASLTGEELEKRIVRQIEHYFGDYNLPRDKFLQQEMKLDDGWIPVEILIKFNRLARLSTNIPFIANCVSKSSSDLIEVNEEKTKIRRNSSKVLPEMNEARRHELILRTLYIKGFPTDCQLDEIEEFLAQYGKVDNIVMRRYQDKATKQWIFKGSVFAVFPKVEEGQKVLDLGTLKFKDQELIMKWQSQYIQDQRNERITKKMEEKCKKRMKRDDGENEDNKTDREELAKGSVLHISDCPGELTREDIKSKLEEFGFAIAFIDYAKGNPEGHIRLQESGTAKQVIEKLEDSKMEFHGASVAFRALEGDEEVEFLNKVKSEMARKRNFSKNQHKRRGGGRREGGGSYFHRKRKGSPNKDDHSSEQKKVKKESE
ncbi:hypothetical protein LSTR_LSTR006084 [Laodelphax striatellus]|uniref:HTH La-type RNA-binding domain-containing protein n=1 Tax=Laodelphax striatellus TaxID=195883 RepID=A0A482WY41_LAOST|nr:hypothetical protein LSTR_LSTR006084 [Laodelphax striatellus]